MRTIEFQVYNFEELPKKAQLNAIESNRDFYDDIVGCFIMENYSDYLGSLSYPTDEIEYSLSYCQGDGMAFYGDLDVEKFINTREKDLIEFGLDKDDLRRIKFLAREGIEIKIERNSFGYHYSHFNTMSTNADYVENYAYGSTNNKTLKQLEKSFDKLESFIQKDVKKVSHYLEGIGYDILEYYREDEQVKDALISNGYEFTESGKIFS